METKTVSTEHIEIREKGGMTHTFIIGTKFRVASIYDMYVNGDCSVDWIVENFEVLERAKVHAALAYYYDNPERIEREWQELLDEDERLFQELNPMTLDKFKDKIRQRLTRLRALDE
jgi:uncharacterized protein (DUF433 family)